MEQAIKFNLYQVWFWASLSSWEKSSFTLSTPTSIFNLNPSPPFETQMWDQENKEPFASGDDPLLLKGCQKQELKTLVGFKT